MIIVKVDALVDSYALKDLSKTIKEMADTGVIVLHKGMEIIDITEDEKAAADVKILETPEGILPQVLR